MGAFSFLKGKEGGTKAGNFLRKQGGAEGLLDKVSATTGSLASKLREAKGQTGLGPGNGETDPAMDDIAPIFGLPPMAAYSIAAILVVGVLSVAFVVLRKKE